MPSEPANATSTSGSPVHLADLWIGRALAAALLGVCFGWSLTLPFDGEPDELSPAAGTSWASCSPWSWPRSTRS